MKTKMLASRWGQTLIGLVVVSLVGWGIALAFTQAMAQADPMEMMKKMMMDRPAAMKKADDTIQKQKAKATKEGKYACCLKHPCDFCAVKMG